MRIVPKLQKIWSLHRIFKAKRQRSRKLRHTHIWDLQILRALVYEHNRAENIYPGLTMTEQQAKLEHKAEAFGIIYQKGDTLDLQRIIDQILTSEAV